MEDITIKEWLGISIIVLIYVGWIVYIALKKDDYDV